jgi:thiamine-monophosphate kinase
MAGRTVRGARNGAELDLLRQIRTRIPPGGAVALGIGDDCALLRTRPGEDIAVTTDLSIDGRHFRLGWHPPQSVGHRTLTRGLSDLAAMGARPLAAFVSLGLPPTLVRPGRGRASWMSRFYDGLLALADSSGISLAGGDLSESPMALADIVLVGSVPRGKALLRSGSAPGDAIYVTGALGGSAAGLARMAERAWTLNPSTRLRIPPSWDSMLQPHLYPQPRLRQGVWLVEHRAATAAIDLSDGLSTDIAHICEESGVAAEIDSAAIPIAAGATLENALHGGEDYELLFTARAGQRLPAQIAGVPITRIGRVIAARPGKPPITLLTPAGPRSLEPLGWQHFR